MYNFAGFRPKYKEGGGDLPGIQWFVIANGVRVQLGNAIKILPQQGADIADAVSDKIYGYAVAFKCKSGVPLDLATPGVDYDGTYTASPAGDIYIAASDNETDKRVMVGVIPALDVVCSALLSAAKGTTTGSDKVGCYFNILTTDASKLNEASASTTVAGYMSVSGVSASDPTDPTDPTPTRILVRAIKTQVAQ